MTGPSRTYAWCGINACHIIHPVPYPEDHIRAGEFHALCDPQVHPPIEIHFIAEGTDAIPDLCAVCAALQIQIEARVSTEDLALVPLNSPNLDTAVLAALEHRSAILREWTTPNNPSVTHEWRTVPSVQQEQLRRKLLELARSWEITASADVPGSTHYRSGRADGLGDAARQLRELLEEEGTAP